MEKVYREVVTYENLCDIKVYKTRQISNYNIGENNYGYEKIAS
ncbi:MAG: hypothetical protein ACK5HL_01465 [Bacilli bacterium]